MIADIQKHLKEEKLAGWLLFDFQGQNALAQFVLKPKCLISRKIFYWIPAEGEPVQMVHAIESHVLSHLPGKCQTYLSFEELKIQLKKLLEGKGTIAMEYSPDGAISYLSKVDGGTLELVRGCGVDVVSSGNFLQYYTCVLNKEQLLSHKKAASFLDALAFQTWEKIKESLKRGTTLTEHGVRLFMLDRMDKEGFVTASKPICAVNAHSASPHFEPDPHDAAVIKAGDFILIDLWCREKGENTVYGDITRVAVASAKPTEKQREIFEIVRLSQKTATEFLQKQLEAGKKVRGNEVDKVAREVIEKAGYGKQFLHRTGHNIYTEDHGPGAHLDSFETLDERFLIPKTCFSIEPGIYLPGAFGIRLEYDIYLASAHSLEITGGIQDAIVTLL